MIFYVRDKKTNKNLVDIEVYDKREDDYWFVQLTSNIDVKEFAITIVNMVNTGVNPDGYINGIDRLSEIRRDWFEKERHEYRASKGVNHAGETIEGEKDACCEMVSRMLKEFIKDFDQYRLVTD